MPGTTTHPRPTRWVALAAGAVVALLATLLAPAAVSPVAAQTATCTTPSNVNGFTPQQLAQRYGIDQLVASGADGAGVTVAILEFGESADLDVLAEWSACMGIDPPTVTQTLVSGASLPAVGTEAQGDVETVAGLVPGADVHVLVTTDGSTSGFASLLDAALDPANTGGSPVDIVVSSYGACEADVPSGDMDLGDAALERMADAGVWFLKSAGDSGSDECQPHGGTCDGRTGTANVEYPTSNPNVTGVGGTQILDAQTEGDATVWNEPGICSAGGGGFSTRFPVPAFQQGFGPASPSGRMLPDVSGLAGHPGYQILTSGGWSEEDGTSFAAPLYAAGLAAVLSELQQESVAPPASLNEALYRAASDPSTYAALFTDVLTTDNDLLDVGCCTAGTGYDTASGLGELDFAAFAGWLVDAATADAEPDPYTPPAAAPAAVVTPAFTG